MGRTITMFSRHLCMLMPSLPLAKDLGPNGCSSTDDTANIWCTDEPMSDTAESFNWGQFQQLREPSIVQALPGEREEQASLLVLKHQVSYQEKRQEHGVIDGSREDAPDAGVPLVQMPERMFSTDRQHIAHLLGILQQGSNKFESDFVEYQLADVHRHGFTFFGKGARRPCLQGAWIHFYGDSRLRFLFSAMLKQLAGDDIPSACPRHDACPHGNRVGEHVPKCDSYYFGNMMDCLDVNASDTRLSFQSNHWAKGSNHSQNLANFTPTSRPDFILVNNGAWDHAGEAVWKQNNIYPPDGSENDEDRKTMFRQIANVAAHVGSLTFAIGYPYCDVEIGNIMMPLYEELAREHWIVYDSVNVTSSMAGCNYCKSWNPSMLPKDHAPDIAKWDSCDMAHTFDTLADLEVELLLNAMCA